MPKKKTVTVDNSSPVIIPVVSENFRVVSIALDKNSNLYGVTDESKVVKYNYETRSWHEMY